jgi:uncharacterized protein YgfB (UPF0149 family)
MRGLTLSSPSLFLLPCCFQDEEYSVMTLTSCLPSYNELSKLLLKIQPDLSPAEIHGLLCGHICTMPGKDDLRWKKILFHDKKYKKVLEVLSQFHAASYQQLSEFSFEFNLALPDDAVDINVRTEALGLWCQGFLLGLALAPTSNQNKVSAEITEALEDITEIAQINFGNIPENEEDETAYLELVEYVRLTILMIFDELRPVAFSQKTNSKTLLH